MSIDFGPLKVLLDDPEVTEIMVNAFDNVFVERGGQILPAGLRLVDARSLDELVQTILFTCGKDITAALRFDGTLPSGARFNITRPPMSPKGPTLTIRKHAAAMSTMEMLVQRKSLSPKAAAFLSACTRGRVNMIISGGTGTGKTTLINALASNIPATERLVSIEDTAELQIRNPNWVRLLTVREGKNLVSTRDGLANALRMRPDRILVGECRGGEAADMLQAMNTGHDGSMTTVHASSSVDCLARLESLVLQGTGDLPLKAVRRNISQAVDLIVQLKRNRNGARFVSEITELTGMEGDIITRATIFTVPEGKSSGEDLRSTGLVPEFMKRLEERDVKLARGFFDPQTAVSF